VSLVNSFYMYVIVLALSVGCFLSVKHYLVRRCSLILLAWI